MHPFIKNCLQSFLTRGHFKEKLDKIKRYFWAVIFGLFSFFLYTKVSRD